MNQDAYRESQPEGVSNKSKAIAVGLTSLGFFIPFFLGAGQFYKGDRKKGIIFSTGQTVNFLLLFAIIGWVTYPIFGVIALWDAMVN